MEICFYMDWSLFQIYNGYLKKTQQQQQQLYTANIANQVTPLILRGQSYVVFWVGKESWINNRLSLSTVSERLNYTGLIEPRPPPPQCAPFFSESHGRDRKTPREDVKMWLQARWKTLEEGGNGGARGWGSISVVDTVFFLKRTNSGSRYLCHSHKDSPVMAGGEPGFGRGDATRGSILLPRRGGEWPKEGLCISRHSFKKLKTKR